MASVRSAGGVPKTIRGFVLSKCIDAMVGSSVARGDILFRGASTWQRLAADSGKFLKSNGSSADPTFANLGGAGGRVLLNSTTVAGAAATTIDVGSIDLNTDLEYEFTFDVQNATGGAINMSWYYNSDTTASNYHKQFFTSGSTTNSSSRANDSIFVSPATTETVSGVGRIRRNFSGKVVIISQYQRAETSTTMLLGTVTTVWATTATNVTNLKLFSSVASGFGIGSIVRVYKI